MPQNNPQYLRWSIPDYRQPARSRNWYIAAGIIVFICLFFSFFSFDSWHLIFLGVSSNFLFALIIVIAAMIMILNSAQPATMINFELGPEGVKLGPNFYDYDLFKNFSVLYKPKQSIKTLYLEFKSTMRPRISVPLRRMDALTVHNFLTRYLDEDFERLNPPLSEQLTKLLKL